MKKAWNKDRLRHLATADGVQLGEAVRERGYKGAVPD